MATASASTLPPSGARTTEGGAPLRVSYDPTRWRLMDPNATLDELLALLGRATALAGMHLPPRVLAHDIHRVIELVEALDSWLTSGGFLPDRWQPASRRTV